MRTIFHKRKTVICGVICTKNEVGPGTLEVKCPFKHRNVTIEEMVKLELGKDKDGNDKEEKKAFFLKSDLTMNKNHAYWHQVQAEMFALKVEWADFVIWTKEDLKIVRILRDPQWAETNIPKLIDFYLNTLIPHCLSA